MSESDSNRPVTGVVRDFLLCDLSLLPTEVLSSINIAVSGELAKRRRATNIDYRLMAAASNQGPMRFGLDYPNFTFSEKMMPGLTALLEQDWSDVFPEMDMEPKYYVYIHAKPSGQRPVRFSGLGVSMNIKGRPFYVGKGCGERAYDLKRNQGHGAILRELSASGVKPSQIVHLVAEGLTEAKALEIESKLIYFFGTQYEPGRRGLLVNLDIPARPRMLEGAIARRAKVLANGEHHPMGLSHG
jgi:hypothetical protein